MTTTAARTVRLGATDYPLVLPSLRDPRLHLASVIITIHVLGQVALDFRVSVPQILAAILTCAVLEVALTFRKTRQFVWPASAMLTGSGVALILRIVGQERGEHWTWDGWYLFAGIAALSLLTKYWIRYRGTHVFNPSNVGLVAAFLVLGSDVIEPLDFWWAPLDFWMLAAYAVILVGGVLITSRLRLLTLAAVFWLTLAVGLGVLAASGHCMTAAWALQPVCGTYFWSVIVASPEVLVFLFFMITDPKTIPQGRTARIAFAVSLGVICTLLMAPQTTEFGAKVGLLAGLVVLTPLRFLLDRALRSERIESLATSSKGRPVRAFAPGAVVGALLVLIPLAIVVAGAPARESAQAVTVAAPAPEIEVDPEQLPDVTVSAEAAALNDQVDPDALALGLAQALAVEGEAIRRADTSLLRSADDAERLIEMERMVEQAATSGLRAVPTHTFDTLNLDVVFTDGPQGGASLGLVATGTVETVTYDAAGAEQDRASEPFTKTFVLQPEVGDRWLIAAEVEDG
ncbi:MAG: hypothetical protein ACRDXF_01555 [Acidimicrobiia bacterium]